MKVAATVLFKVFVKILIIYSNKLDKIILIEDFPLLITPKQF